MKKGKQLEMDGYGSGVTETKGVWRESRSLGKHWSMNRPIAGRTVIRKMKKKTRTTKIQNRMTKMRRQVDTKMKMEKVAEVSQVGGKASGGEIAQK